MKKVIIIGGGISAWAVANSFRKQGLQIKIISQNQNIIQLGV